jgi:hypothetical protein
LSAFLFYLIQFTWGLAVNLLSVIAFFIMKIKGYESERFYNAIITYVPSDTPRGAIALGVFIFITYKAGVPRENFLNRDISIHEYGHSFQVMMLGALYWFIIGIPSLIWAQCFAAYREKNNISYYSIYTETWANRLGETMTGLKIKSLS